MEDLPLIIIQARTGSSRLPNKMLRPFYGSQSVLEILIERLKPLKKLQIVSDIIVATTDCAKDDDIVKLTDKLMIKSFRGSENDVLQRFINASKKFNASKIIRICADNVFIDLQSLIVLGTYFHSSNADYVSFKKSDGTPSILTHYGFFAECVTLNALEKVNKLTQEKKFHEHVTNYIYNAPDIFNSKLFPIEDRIKGIENYDKLRLTLDTQDDFEIQQIIYQHFADNNLEISPEKIIDYINQEHPEFYNKMESIINQNSK